MWPLHSVRRQGSDCSSHLTFIYRIHPSSLPADLITDIHPKEMVLITLPHGMDNLPWMLTIWQMVCRAHMLHKICLETFSPCKPKMVQSMASWGLLVSAVAILPRHYYQALPGNFMRGLET